MKGDPVKALVRLLNGSTFEVELDRSEARKTWIKVTNPADRGPIITAKDVDIRRTLPLYDVYKVELGNGTIEYHEVRPRPM